MVPAIPRAGAAGLSAAIDSEARSLRLAAALRFVPGLGPGLAARRILRMPGGSVNQLWRVDTPAGSYAVRLGARRGPAPGSLRALEYRLHLLAASAALAPRILHAEPRDGLLVMDWVPGRPWPQARYAERAWLRRLVEALMRLQRIAPPGPASFRPGQIAERYAAIARPAPGARRLRLARHVVAVAKYAAVVAALRLPPVIVHGDLGTGNVLGARPWLIDWEYAQIASPCYEYGSLLALYPELAPHLPRLPSLGHLSPRDYRHGLAAAAAVYRGVNALWLAACIRPPATGAARPVPAN